jgi:DNA-binding Xre family transcriptional regulator
MKNFETELQIICEMLGCQVNLILVHVGPVSAHFI